MLILSSSKECPDTLEHANFLSDVLTIVKPLLFTDESSVSLSKFKDGSPYTHTVVVKSYVKQKLTPLQREQVETEAQLLSTLSHQHVAPLLAAVEDARAIHLIMPWCDGGDLRQHMASLRIPPSPTPRPPLQNLSITTSPSPCNQTTCLPPPQNLNASVSDTIQHSRHHHTHAATCIDKEGGVLWCTGASQHDQPIACSTTQAAVDHSGSPETLAMSSSSEGIRDKGVGCLGEGIQRRQVLVSCACGCGGVQRGVCNGSRGTTNCGPGVCNGSSSTTADCGTGVRDSSCGSTTSCGAGSSTQGNGCAGIQGVFGCQTGISGKQRCACCSSRSITFGQHGGPLGHIGSGGANNVNSSSSSSSCEVEARLRDFLLRPLLQALALLQQQGIVHRDISPKNILVHQGQVKLSDFGLSVHVPPTTPITQDAIVMDPRTPVTGSAPHNSTSTPSSTSGTTVTVPAPYNSTLGNSCATPHDSALCSSVGTFPASAPSSIVGTGSSVSWLASTLRDSADSSCSSSSGGSQGGGLLGCGSTLQGSLHPIAQHQPQLDSARHDELQKQQHQQHQQHQHQHQQWLDSTLHDELQQQQQQQHQHQHQQQQQQLTTPFSHNAPKGPELRVEQQKQPSSPSHAHTHPNSLMLPRTRSSPELMSSVSGTPLYAPPEVLQAVFRNQPVHPNIHHKNDVWALGVIAVEALTGRHPFSQGGVGMAMQGGPSAQAWCPGYGSCSGSSDANVLFSISSGQQLRLPPQLSPVCSDLLSAMLHRDPAHRATASQLLAHPFITQQAPALAPAGTLVRREAGGHAPAHHKVSPFKQAHGQLPPRPPPHRP